VKPQQPSAAKVAAPDAAAAAADAESALDQVQAEPSVPEEPDVSATEAQGELNHVYDGLGVQYQGGAVLSDNAAAGAVLAVGCS
jgi:hypothetical protein